MKHNRYPIHKVYQKNANSVRKDKLGEVGLVKDRTPKIRFILWLAFLNKLKTKDWFFRIGVTPNDFCAFCGIESESITLLFFAYRFSQNCLNASMNWLGSKTKIFSLKTKL